MGKNDEFNERLEQGEKVEKEFYDNFKSEYGLIWNKGEDVKYYPIPFRFTELYGDSSEYKSPDFYSMKYKTYFEMKSYLFQRLKKRDVEAYYKMYQESREDVYLIVPSHSGMEGTYEVCNVQYLYENILPNVEWKKIKDYDWFCEITPEIRECYKPFNEIFTT